MGCTCVFKKKTKIDKKTEFPIIPFDHEVAENRIVVVFLQALLLLAKPIWFGDFILSEAGLTVQWSPEITANSLENSKILTK
jgi:hypothetical protein